MDSYAPIVITSRAAENHLNTIKSHHTDLLQRMQEQNMKVQNYNAQKQADQAMQVERDQTAQKENKQFEMDSQSKMLEQQNKQRELEIKASALTL